MCEMNLLNREKRTQNSLCKVSGFDESQSPCRIWYDLLSLKPQRHLIVRGCNSVINFVGFLPPLRKQDIIDQQLTPYLWTRVSTHDHKHELEMRI